MNHHRLSILARRGNTGGRLTCVLAIFALLMVLKPGLAIAEIVPAAAKTYDHGDPTDQEQLMLELINRARANPQAEASRLGLSLNQGLFPGSISTDPKPPLAAHPALILAARRHSGWMLDTDIFSHTGIHNSSPGDRMASAGYQFSGSTSWAENIAWGGTSSTPDLNRETVHRHEGLFRSPGHRINLLGANNRHVGLGILSGRFDGWNAVMATQKFARSDAYPASLVVGVVFNDRNGNGFYDPGEGIPGVSVVPDSGGWNAVTSSSGGYAVPYAGTAGMLTLAFRGGSSGEPITRTVGKTGGNLKVDLEVAGSISRSPEIEIRLPNGRLLASGKFREDFGNVRSSSGKRSRTFVITNRGSARLSGLRVVKSGAHHGDFKISPRIPNSLAPGKSLKFKVTFSPKSTGIRKALIRIKSNDADESKFKINLSGRGAGG